MIDSRSWYAESRRVVILLAVAAGIGWYSNHLYEFLAAGLFAVVAVWMFQLWRIQRWLNHPEGEPPNGYGIWGLIFDRIYHLQRKDKEARDRLQSALEYLRGSLASMRDGVIMIDEKAAIDWSNEAAGRLLGLRYPEDQGQPVLNLIRLPEFHSYFLAEDYQEPLQVEITGEQDQSLQFEFTRFGAGSRLVFVRDVTAKARLEQMRRDFVGNVSHELRTPLTVIKGYLETMLANRDAMDSRFVKPLEQMDQQAQRMENLLKDLLWLSRIESVRSEAKTEMVDVAGLLEELADEWNTNYPHRNVGLELETRDKIPGDYRELHSAVSNLVLNALKYSDDHAPVCVCWSRRDDEYWLSVRDKGIGIDPSHIPRLTERFYRVDESRSSATGGTGLGLAIVKHVAAAHRAELRIDSEPGEGSVFSLVFPA